MKGLGPCCFNATGKRSKVLAPLLTEKAGGLLLNGSQRDSIKNHPA
jgi:hypothetical protein